MTMIASSQLKETDENVSVLTAEAREMTKVACSHLKAER